MKRPETIYIAGAGLVGSLLSVLLGQRGYRVNILERRADMRSLEVEAGRSINLALSSRGIHALKLAGLMDDVEPLLIPMKGRQLHYADGHQEFMPYGQRPHEVIYSISRRDLNCLMMSRAEAAEPVNIQFMQTLESIDFPERRMTIRDLKSDQIRSESFDLFIGADGAGSRTRRALMAEVGGESTSEFLDHDYKELEIPPAPGTGNRSEYLIEANALHIWPRGDFMLIALPNQDGSFTVTLFLPKTGPVSFEQLQQPEQIGTFFQKHFPDAYRLIPELEQDFANHPQGLLGTVRCAPWFHSDRALILGDASHAVVPFHGQGMNAGFEDCSELMRLLDQYNDCWADVLPEFDRIRRPNANAIADMAIENYITMRDSVADPQFQLKKELGFELEQRFPTRFVPRYSMVMFHLIPYAEAFRRGEIQQAILGELVDGRQSLDQVNYAQAEQLILSRLTPFNDQPG